jgi:glycosyltransferase involved in cell wall biosynthesis
MNLSIITVNLNNKDGLIKTIDSVASQDYKNFEFIIIDGKSVDGSIDVIRQFQESEASQNFSWISESDNGVFEAMNKGISMAKGEYLLFLNSGDFLIDKFVLSDVCKNDYEADYLCARCNFSKDGKVVHVSTPVDVHTFVYYYKYSLNHQSTFIRRSLFDRYGMYRVDFKYCSDWEFFFKTIILDNCSTYRLDRIICDYNLEGMSSVESNKESRNIEVAQVLSNPLLQKFIPDYDLWFREKEEMAPLLWFKSKTYLYYPFYTVYRFLCLLVDFKNKLFSNR